MKYLRFSSDTQQSTKETKTKKPNKLQRPGKFDLQTFCDRSTGGLEPTIRDKTHETNV